MAYESFFYSRLVTTERQTKYSKVYQWIMGLEKHSTVFASVKIHYIVPYSSSNSYYTIAMLENDNDILFQLQNEIFFAFMVQGKEDFYSHEMSI